MTILTLKQAPQAPLEAEVISPDNFQGRTAAEISNLKVMHGNAPARLGDFFGVDGDGSSEIVLNGDLSGVKSIAARMQQGRVQINGNAGMHLGAWMHGGEIQVSGNVGDWAGAEMTGGRIHIRGNAGHGLGGAYRGSRYGMNRGIIIAEGNAGNEVGSLMRRGLIVVMGDAGDFTGAFMIAGTVVVFGKLGLRAGAGLLRGTIIAFHPPELLPTFRYACSYRPDFLKLIFCELQAQNIRVLDVWKKGLYRRYSGDFNRSGKGEILVYDQR